MPRIAYLVELDANNITYLAWAAGLATGAGNEAAANALNDIVNRIEAYEIPDDVTKETLEFLTTEDEDDSGVPYGEEANLGDTEDIVLELGIAGEESEALGPAEEGEREPDPNFPGPGLYIPPPPINNPADFGAGPPPRL